LGDSITLSCKRPSRDWFDQADLDCRYRVAMNAGVGVDTVEGMRARVDLLVDVHPDLCVVQGGGNDLVQGRRVPAVLSDLDAIYETLLEAEITPLATTVLPRGDTSEDRLADVAAMNRALQAADMLVCDWTTPLLDDCGRLRRRFADDGTHPNPAGVAIMASCLRRVLP
jgi:lysophospholipase L1-like esterase